MEEYSENKYAYVNSATDTQIVTGRCLLVRVVINKTVNAVTGIIDGTTGTALDANVALLKASVVEGPYEYNVTMATGLRFCPAGVGDYTIVYRT